MLVNDEATTKAERPPHALRLAAIGMEAEFEVRLEGRRRDPKQLFGTPQRFVRQPLLHREGTSFHLPTGGAVYFDTGVIEVATPVIEIEPGCAARAGRSLWEGILFLRDELDAWERRLRRDVRLVGFSTHYNISFDVPLGGGGRRTVEDLALLLAYVLPLPVMLLAANRRSSGIGVRPRGDRVEITADFTPSAALMIATATLITGITRAVMRWRSFALAELRRRGIPVIAGFLPIPHTSRRGWLAHRTSFPRDPFTSEIDTDLWELRDGRRLPLREIAGRITRAFWHPIRRVSDPFTFRLIGSVMAGRAPSLLELPDRPPEYEHVGRLCRWDQLFPERTLSRSRYEQVLIHAIRGERLRLGNRWYTPIGMRGWSQVVFRDDRDRRLHVVPIDALLDHLEDWAGAGR